MPTATATVRMGGWGAQRPRARNSFWGPRKPTSIPARNKLQYSDKGGLSSLRRGAALPSHLAPVTSVTQACMHVQMRCNHTSKPCAAAWTMCEKRLYLCKECGDVRTGRCYTGRRMCHDIVCVCVCVAARESVLALCLAT